MTTLGVSVFSASEERLRQDGIAPDRDAYRARWLFPFDPPLCPRPRRNVVEGLRANRQDLKRTIVPFRNNATVVSLDGHQSLYPYPAGVVLGGSGSGARVRPRPGVTGFDEGESDLDRSRSLSATPQIQQSENRIAHRSAQLSDWLGYTYPLVCPTR